MKSLIANTVKRLLPWTVAGFFLLGILVAHHQLNSYHITRIRDLVWSVSSVTLSEALLVTMAGYAIVTFYDRLSLYFVHKFVSFGKTSFAAFLSFAVSHNTGHAWLSGASLRYRFYSAWGISGVDVVKIMIANTMAYGLGLSSVLLAAYGFMPAGASQDLSIPGLDIITAIVACAYTAYWIIVVKWRPVLTIKQVPLRLPTAKFTLLQAIVGSADIIAAGTVLYVLLDYIHPMPFSEFLVAYIASLLLGTASQVPGGLGVFEAAFLHVLSPQYHASDILASLILYRMIYYFLPLIIAGAMYLAYEMHLAHKQHRPLKTLMK